MNIITYDNIIHINTGALGFDTVCGVPALNSGANGGGYDYVSIPDGQCDYPSSTTPAIATKTADRYCGTAFKYQLYLIIARYNMFIIFPAVLKFLLILLLLQLLQPLLAPHPILSAPTLGLSRLGFTQIILSMVMLVK